MELLAQLYLVIDGILIAPFRLFDAPLAGFVFGIAVLAFLSILLGEYTMAGAYLFNRRHFKEQTEEMVRMHNLSIEAIRSKDKESYRATNKWANEHFGKAFFARMALFACSMWPVPFALGWLDTRFAGMGIMELPFTSWQPGYAFFYIGLYIALRVAFAKLAKPRIPFFNRVVEMMQHETDEEVKSWGELNTAPSSDGPGDDPGDASSHAPREAEEHRREKSGKKSGKKDAQAGAPPEAAPQAAGEPRSETDSTAAKNSPADSDIPPTREAGKA